MIFDSVTLFAEDFLSPPLREGLGVGLLRREGEGT